MEQKFVKMMEVTWPRWLPCLYMWLPGKSLKNSFLELKGQIDDHWMTFDFFTVRSNMLPAKGLESRLAQVSITRPLVLRFYKFSCVPFSLM